MNRSTSDSLCLVYCIDFFSFLFPIIVSDLLVTDDSFSLLFTFIIDFIASLMEERKFDSVMAPSLRSIFALMSCIFSSQTLRRRVLCVPKHFQASFDQSSGSERPESDK